MVGKLKLLLLVFLLSLNLFEASAQNQDEPKIWDSWERVADLPFAHRDGVGVVHFKDEIWMMGGWVYGPLTNEIYKSSDGINWEFVGFGDWPGRHCAGMVAFNNKLWVISGDGYPDVWSSEDGVHWVLEVKEAPWGKRYAPYVTVFDNKLWLIGGVRFWNEDGIYSQDLEIPYNDVWSSEDGVHWKLEIEQAPWGPRGIIHGSLIHQDEIWIVGGGSKLRNSPTTIYNDVWKSKNGIDWELVNDKAPWASRIHFSIISYDGKLWVMDGTTNEKYLNDDVWYSEDGIEWSFLNSATKFPATHASTIFVHNNALYISAGLGLDAIYRYRAPQKQSIIGDTAVIVTLDTEPVEVSFSLSSALQAVYHIQDTSIIEILDGQKLKAKKLGKTKIGVSHAGAYGFYPLDTAYIDITVKVNQNIIAEVQPAAIVQDTIKVNIQTISGLPVSIVPSDHYKIIDDNTIVTTTSGNISIKLMQEGGEYHHSWNHTLDIQVHEPNEGVKLKQKQYLLNSISSVSTVLGSTPLDLNLYSSSGLPLSFLVVDSNIAEVTQDNLIKIKAAGTTTILVRNEGDEEYFPLYTASIELFVQKKKQFFEEIPYISSVYGDAPLDLEFISNSGLPLSYSVLDTNVAEVFHNKLIIKNAGSTKVIASNAGNSEYLPLDTAMIELSVRKKNQAVHIYMLTDVMVADTVAINVQSDLGLPISIRSNKDISIINDVSFIPHALGYTSIEFFQEGDKNHNPWNKTVQVLVHAPSNYVVYPNPAKDYVKVFVDNKTDVVKKIEVSTMNGNTLKTIPASNALNVYLLDLHEFVPGVYLIKIMYSNGRTLTSKFIKSNN